MSTTTNGIMESYNMTNVEIPSAYNDVKNDDDKISLESYAFFGLLKLEIGKKYYTIYKKMIMAFKMNKIVFKPHNVIYEVLMANGEVVNLNALRDFNAVGKIQYGLDLKVFLCKEDVLDYRQTKEDYLLYTEKWDMEDIISKYFKNMFYAREKVIEQGYCYCRDCIVTPKRKIHTFYRKGYYVDKDSSVRSIDAQFKYCWADGNGCHYSVCNECNYDGFKGVILYPTMRDALNTIETFDFDDDEEVIKDTKITLRITLSKSKLGDVVDMINEFGCHIE